MIITCPRCATRYLLEAGVVRPPGRQVRCARCTHTWFQEPAVDLPNPNPVPVEDPMGPSPIADKSRMLPAPEIRDPLPPLPHFETRPEPSFQPTTSGSDTMAPPPAYGERQRTRSRGMVVLLGLSGTVAFFLLLFLSMPNEVVSFWPSSAGVYSALGIEVNKSGFKIIATHKLEAGADEVPTIVVSGKIINETDRDLPVPSVRLAVRDRSGKEIHSWMVRAEQDRLGPHAEGSFGASLQNPPANAFDLEVRFAREGER